MQAYATATDAAFAAVVQNCGGGAQATTSVADCQAAADALVAADEAFKAEEFPEEFAQAKADVKAPQAAKDKTKANAAASATVSAMFLGATIAASTIFAL